MDLSRQHVVDMLRKAGLPEMADEALRDLPDPVDRDQAAVWGAKAGISLGELISRMGGSP